MLKNVVSHSVATAFASNVLPVPGGPNSKTPFQGVSNPVNSSGYFSGITTASFSNAFAWSNPTMLCQGTPGFLVKISRDMAIARSRYSLSTPKCGNALNKRFSNGSSPSTGVSSCLFSHLPPGGALETLCPTNPPSKAGASACVGAGTFSRDAFGICGGFSRGGRLSSRGFRVSLRARRLLVPPASNSSCEVFPRVPSGGSLGNFLSKSAARPSAFRVNFGFRPKRIS
mmetsp:Transcript_91505/g.144578  ORF Transcript_91505/g.144578 Transcript_91505/m.144578 type:complete len:228 (+) Transcript_91505:862-1545(+)